MRYEDLQEIYGIIRRTNAEIGKRRRWNSREVLREMKGEMLKAGYSCATVYGLEAESRDRAALDAITAAGFSGGGKDNAYVLPFFEEAEDPPPEIGGPGSPPMSKVGAPRGALPW